MPILTGVAALASRKNGGAASMAAAAVPGRSTARRVSCVCFIASSLYLWQAIFREQAVEKQYPPPCPSPASGGGNAVSRPIAPSPSGETAGANGRAARASLPRLRGRDGEGAQ